MSRAVAPSEDGRTAKTALLRHLARSPAVRAALKQELWRGVGFLCGSVVTAVVIFYFRPKPLAEVLWSAGVGLGGAMLLWLVAAIRTVRAVMREQGLLAR